MNCIGEERHPCILQVIKAQREGGWTIHSGCLTTDMLQRKKNRRRRPNKKRLEGMRENLTGKKLRTEQNCQETEKI